MRPGRLDRWLVIEKAIQTQSNIGEVIEDWVEHASVWASFRPISATERFTSSGTHSVEVGNFRVRHLDGVLPTMRLDYEGRKWRILGIAEVGRKEGLDLTAEVIG